jgi:hypothetical protein
MFRGKGSNFDNLALKKGLISRCDAISGMAQKASREHFVWANIWGRVHIILGIATICFSSLSAIFTFYDQQWVVVTLCILSTIMAACATFLNPAHRESKRREYYSVFFVLQQNSEQTKLLIEASAKQEDILIQRVEDLNKNLEKIMKESYR